MNYSKITMNGKQVTLVNGKEPRNVTVNGTLYEPIPKVKYYRHKITCSTGGDIVIFYLGNNRRDKYENKQEDIEQVISQIQEESKQPYTLATGKVYKNGRYYLVKSVYTLKKSETWTSDERIYGSFNLEPTNGVYVIVTGSSQTGILSDEVTEIKKHVISCKYHYNSYENIVKSVEFYLDRDAFTQKEFGEWMNTGPGISKYQNLAGSTTTFIPITTIFECSCYENGTLIGEIKNKTFAIESITDLGYMNFRASVFTDPTETKYIEDFVDIVS